MEESNVQRVDAPVTICRLTFRPALSMTDTCSRGCILCATSVSSNRAIAPDSAAATHIACRSKGHVEGLRLSVLVQLTA